MFYTPNFIRLFATFAQILFPVVIIFSLFSGTHLGWWALSAVSFVVLYLSRVTMHNGIMHGAWKMSKSQINVLSVFAFFSTFIPVISWCVTHQRHHENEDTPNDPHSPSWLGWKCLFYYFYPTTELKHVKRTMHLRRLLSNRFLLWFEKHAYTIMFVLWGIALLFSWQLWAHLFIIPAGITVWFEIAGVALVHGWKPGVEKQSKNLEYGFMNYVTIGEQYHKNHHENPMVVHGHVELMQRFFNWLNKDKRS